MTPALFTRIRVKATPRVGAYSCARRDVCKNKFSSGELITLTIKPGTEDDMIRVQAQIVSFSDWGMHCKFAHLDRKMTGAINHWVSTA